MLLFIFQYHIEGLSKVLVLRYRKIGSTDANFDVGTQTKFQLSSKEWKNGIFESTEQKLAKFC